MIIEVGAWVSWSKRVTWLCGIIGGDSCTTWPCGKVFGMLGRSGYYYLVDKEWDCTRLIQAGHTGTGCHFVEAFCYLSCNLAGRHLVLVVSPQSQENLDLGLIGFTRHKEKDVLLQSRRIYGCIRPRNIRHPVDLIARSTNKLYAM